MPLMIAASGCHHAMRAVGHVASPSEHVQTQATQCMNETQLRPIRNCTGAGGIRDRSNVATPGWIMLETVVTHWLRRTSSATRRARSSDPRSISGLPLGDPGADETGQKHDIKGAAWARRARRSFRSTAVRASPTASLEHERRWVDLGCNNQIDASSWLLRCLCGRGMHRMDDSCLHRSFAKGLCRRTGW